MNGGFPTRFVVGIGVSVAILEALSVIAEIYTKAVLQLDPGYTTPLALHGLMGTVVGAVYASMRVSKAKGEAKDGRG